MSTNAYGLRLRSSVRSRRRRLVRSAIGLIILLLLCLIYPGVRNLTAQLLGIASTPSMAADLATDDIATVAAKRSPRHSLFNPLANDARTAAGLILPPLPPEPEFGDYASEQEPLAIDVDDAVSDQFRDVEPVLIATAFGGGGSGWGARAAMMASAGAGAGGVGGSWAGVSGDAQTAAGETSTGEDVSDDIAAKTSFTGSAVDGDTSGQGVATGTAASVAKDAAVAPPRASASATPASNDTVPTDIAPATMVIAELTSPPGARADSSTERTSATPATAGVAGSTPGILADVPEPAALLIFGLGLAAAAYRTRSRRA